MLKITATNSELVLHMDGFRVIQKFAQFLRTQNFGFVRFAVEELYSREEVAPWQLLSSFPRTSVPFR
jgi:hypothetical protein